MQIDSTKSGLSNTPDVIYNPPSVSTAPTTPTTHDATDLDDVKPRSDSNPLLDKYPVLKFHNVDVPDTSPSHTAPERGLQIQELDKLIIELQS